MATVYRISRKTVLVAALALMSPSVAGIAFGSPLRNPNASIAGPLEDQSLESAAWQLSDDWSVPISTARERMLRQPHLDDLSNRIGIQAGESFAGSYIDQAGDGRLVISSTDVESLSHYVNELPEFDQDLIRVEAANYSYASLQALYRELKPSLDALVKPLEVNAKVNVIADKLTVMLQVDSADISADSMSQYMQRLQDALSSRPEIELSSQVRKYHTASCLNDLEICDQPLRGGVELAREHKATYCSSALVVKKGSRKFILTAGHCLTGSPGATWNTGIASEFPTRNLHLLGTLDQYGVGSLGNGPDYGDIEITNTNWTFSPTVLVQKSFSTTHPTVENELYPITAVGATSALTPNQSYLCKTGAVSDTTCGKYLGLYANAGTTGHYYADTSLYACQGDSGSLIYIAGKGYGILVLANATQSNSLYVWTKTVVQNISCGPGAAYQGLWEAMNNLGVSLL